MRISDYIVFGCKDLGRQLARTVLTVTALTISAAILVTLAAISIGGQQTIINQFGDNEALSLITVTPNQASATLSPYGNVQEVNAGANKLTDDTVSQLQKIPHVTVASPRVSIWELNHFMIDGNDKQFVAQAQGIPNTTELPLLIGRKFEPGDTKNTVIIGESYAKELGYAPSELVGKTIHLVTQKGYRGEGATIPSATASRQVNEAFGQQETTLTAKIIGVSAKGPDQNAILLPLEWTRNIRTAQYNEAAGVKKIDQLEADGYGAIRVMADRPENVELISSAIKQLGYGQISTKEQLQRLEQFTSIMWVILSAVAIIAVIAAALGVANTMLMAVSEQGYTIAVWRAVGARRRTIVRLFLIQAGLLGLLGGGIGAAVGGVVSQYVNAHIAALLAAQNLTITSFALLPWWLLAGTTLLTMMFAILAGLYPAYKAAKADPSAALRSN